MLLKFEINGKKLVKFIDCILVKKILGKIAH